MIRKGTEDSIMFTVGCLICRREGLWPITGEMFDKLFVLLNLMVRRYCLRGALVLQIIAELQQDQCHVEALFNGLSEFLDFQQLMFENINKFLVISVINIVIPQIITVQLLNVQYLRSDKITTRD